MKLPTMIRNHKSPVFFRDHTFESMDFSARMMNGEVIDYDEGVCSVCKNRESEVHQFNIKCL